MSEEERQEEEEHSSEEDEIVVSCPRKNGDEEFVLSRSAAKRCDMIKSQMEMFEEDGLELGVLPLSNIDADLMPVISEFLEHPYEERAEGELTDFELGWMPEDTKELAALLLAANYLDCGDMMDSLTQHTANLMKGKTPEQLREMFNTPDDIPDDKKKEIQKQNDFLLEK